MMCTVAATVFDTARQYEPEPLSLRVIRLRATVNDTGPAVENLDARLASIY